MCDSPSRLNYRKGCRCAQCAEASAAYNKLQYEKNKDKILERKAAHHLANREARLSAMRDYYIRNRSNLREKGKRWYWENRDRDLETSKKWQRDNPERVRHLSQARRARVLNADHGCVTPEVWASFYGKPCAYCGEEATQVDHVHPLSKGGPHCVSNLAPSCKKCNTSKGSRILPPEETPNPLYACTRKEDEE